ncbi:MAG: phospholipase [Proteobacteria bacterium]|nr:phospholipase [Pseudomonadota bacterium]
MSTLDGPRLPPANGGPTRRIVILAHGYGSNGQDLIGLAPYLAQALPDAAFVSPNAPEPVPGYPGGHQWFPISRLDPALMAAGVRGAAASLDGFIDAELARHGLPPSACALVGFSQGTMMSLHVGLRRAEPLGAILGLSGMLADAGPAASRPPVALVHGSQDEVIPIGALFASLEGLAAAGVPALWRISHGTGHSVSEDGLALGAAFLRDALAGRFAGWGSPQRRGS